MTQDLARKLHNKSEQRPADALHIRRAVVVAVTGPTATINLDGRDVPEVTICQHVAGAFPGDTAEVLMDGPTPIIIGIDGAMTWHTVGAASQPAFQNSWVQELNRPLSYALDSLGFVHIRGKAKSGVDVVVFTLPSGFRPAQNEDFPIMWNNANQVGMCKVTTTGDVQALGVSPGSNWVTFSGVTFFADGS